MTTDLDDKSWKDLLTAIKWRNVVPVIGAGVVTRGDDQRHFYPWLAGRLAESLDVRLDTASPALSLNDVATRYLIKGGNRNTLYMRLFQILEDECPPPGQALLDLASIPAFNLYLTTTFDPLLQQALESRRPGPPGTSVLAFSRGSIAQDLSTHWRSLVHPTVFHLLGRISPMPDYVVWEDDMLEFILALNSRMPLMTRLGQALKEGGLLVLGLRFSDWLVRFFLRVSHQDPLSMARTHNAYLADGPDDFPPESLVLFFGAVNRGIQVIAHDPVAFCAELARRWTALHPDVSPAAPPPTAPPPPLPPVDQDMPDDAIFVSYAREDVAAAETLVRGLQQVGCIVWYDQVRLQAGEDWHNSLEDQVMKRCGLFLSVISSTTEAARESYYHLERNWAASRVQRMAHDEEFYIPVVIDDAPLSFSREPRVFHQKQATRLAGGTVTVEFSKRLLGLQRKAMSAPR
jgi:hypothetical protein